VDINLGDLKNPQVQALLRIHLAHAAEQSPPESIYALDLSGLSHPSVTFWTIEQGGALLGCGALKAVEANHGEIKSMHTYAAHRGRGVGKAMVSHIIKTARTRGYKRLSLETGSTQGYAPAWALYRHFGFTECSPFGDYDLDPYSIFMTLYL